MSRTQPTPCRCRQPPHLQLQDGVADAAQLVQRLGARQARVLHRRKLAAKLADHGVIGCQRGCIVARLCRRVALGRQLLQARDARRRGLRGGLRRRGRAGCVAAWTAGWERGAASGGVQGWGGKRGRQHHGWGGKRERQQHGKSRVVNQPRQSLCCLGLHSDLTSQLAERAGPLRLVAGGAQRDGGGRRRRRRQRRRRQQQRQGGQACHSCPWASCEPLRICCWLQGRCRGP